MAAGQSEGPHKQGEGPSFGLDKLIDRLEGHRESIGDRKEAGELRGQRTRSKAEVLLTRVLSGFVYGVVVVGALIAGTWPTAVLFAAMAWLCCSEFYQLTRLSGRMPNEIIGLTFAIVMPIAAHVQSIQLLFISIMALLVASGIWYVVTPRANIADVTTTLFGPLYTALPLSTMVIMRGFQPNIMGAILTLAVMSSIWANDTLAYFVGSRFGRHKLAPRISPNKSIEGFWGGIAGSIAVWVVAAAFHVAGMSIVHGLIAGPLVGVCAVAGDLFESRIKRGVGVKDSGNIMPGHGGLLDRSDALLFGSTMAYLILHLGGIL